MSVGDMIATGERRMIKFLCWVTGAPNANGLRLVAMMLAITLFISVILYSTGCCVSVQNIRIVE